MLTYLVQAVLEVMHLLKSGSKIFLTTSFYSGRAILLVLLKICNFLSDVFAAVVIIAEELYYFLCELHESALAVIHYMQTSANGGVNCLLESIVIFCRHIGRFFINTKLHTKLLATNLGSFVCFVLELLKNALLLIADSAWWTITFIPRSVLNAGIIVGDIIVECITSIRKAVVYAVTVVVHDIFRLTIGLVLLFLLWHNRRRLGLGFVRCCIYVKRLLLAGCRRLLIFRSWLFQRRRTGGVLAVQRHTPIRSRLSRPSISPALSEKSIDHHQRCVVCRDRQKCVLLLPCKHLCLCEECADYMIFSAQSQTCPLCRTNINHSMSVYT